MPTYEIKENIDDSNIIKNSMKQRTVLFSSASDEGCQYLYIGDLTEFFSLDNNLAIFRIMGSGVSGTGVPSSLSQAEYHLMIRKAGDYTTRLYIDMLQIAASQDTSPIQLNQATAYYNASQNNGTVKVYVRHSSACTRNMALIDVAYAKGGFTSKLEWGSTFTAPTSGFSVHSGGDWVTAR